MADFVEAYSKTTKEKQVIPAAWLESKNPKLNSFTTTAPREPAASKNDKKES